MVRGPVVRIAGVDVGKVTAVVVAACLADRVDVEQVVRVTVSDMDDPYQMVAASREVAAVAGWSDVVVFESGVSSRMVSRFAVWSHELRGAIVAALAGYPALIERVAPTQVKRLVAGRGNASKSEVRAAVEFLVGFRPDEHVADAAALVLCCAVRDLGMRVPSARGA